MSLDNITYNEKNGISLKSTNNNLINLFFKLNRDTYKNTELYEWINKAFNENPLLTMKILFNSRDCRGGKGDRKTFINSMNYIKINYYNWWVINVQHIPEYGRYLDLIEMYEDTIETTKSNDKLIKLIVNQLNEDYENMRQGNPISLLAKWIPSEGKKWNKTGILRYICKELFNVKVITPYHYKKLRTMYLTPLRSYLRIVESYMCSGKWNDIDYATVPSIAMNNLKNAFSKHSPELFNTWKLSLSKGETKVCSSQVDPHILVNQYMKKQAPDEVIEAQWLEILNKIKEFGSFKDTLVLSDVSGSMKGTPMEVSIALGILISSLTSETFKNQIITFEENPQWHIIPNDCTSLYSKVKNVCNMSWGGNTNLYKVFDLILNRAKDLKLPNANMPKRLIILSDMQFDQVVDSQDTQFLQIKKNYKDANYDVPQIVFWNLRGDTTLDFPVCYNEKDTALISGYRACILKQLINCTDFTPYTIMMDTLNDPRYDIIVSPN